MWLEDLQLEPAALGDSPETARVSGLLERAVSELPRRFREVFLLCEVERVPQEEVAQISPARRRRSPHACSGARSPASQRGARDGEGGADHLPSRFERFTVKCNEAEIAMSLKRDGQLDEETRAALEAHLAQCVQCQRWSQTMQVILDRAALPRLRASAGFEAGVVARATAPPGSNQSLVLQRPWLYALAGAAAMLLAAISFGWLAGLTPTVQAGAVLDEALRSHQEAVMDFARSVTLLPGAKPEMEVDLVRRDLAESHLLRGRRSCARWCGWRSLRSRSRHSSSSR
jgi:hypothetical protein